MGRRISGEQKPSAQRYGGRELETSSVHTGNYSKEKSHRDGAGTSPRGLLTHKLQGVLQVGGVLPLLQPDIILGVSFLIASLAVANPHGPNFPELCNCPPPRLPLLYPFAQQPLDAHVLSSVPFLAQPAPGVCPRCLPPDIDTYKASVCILLLPLDIDQVQSAFQMISPSGTFIALH